jgi:CheY-like chemotaxis protein
VSEHLEVQELLALYALGAVDPYETARVQMHLERCWRCEGELGGYAKAVRALGERPQPPPHLLERILAAVRRTAPYTIVLVDDHADTRFAMRLQLELQGGFVVVGEGADGVDAITLALQHQPDFLVLDLLLPGLTGVDAIPAIRESSPRTRIVAFSGFDDLVRVAWRRGVAASVPKGAADLRETLLRLAAA